MIRSVEGVNGRSPVQENIEVILFLFLRKTELP
jgi:hypothetical protein